MKRLAIGFFSSFFPMVFLLSSRLWGFAPCTPNSYELPCFCTNSLTLLANEQDAYTQNFNPYSPGVISGTQGLIYETLLNVNRLDGTVKPWLASSDELARDAQSITFHLRQGVSWSDGQP